MSETEYLFCINDFGEDFITTSFVYNINNDINFISMKDKVSTIHIFHFNNEIDMSKLKYVAIDYTLDPFTSFNRKYTNSTALRFYEVALKEQDDDRSMVTLDVIDSIYSFDIYQYKREKKIDIIIT